MFILAFFSSLFKKNQTAENVSYGDKPGMVYDEYATKSKKAPVVIFWHGGGWQSGDKSGYGYVGAFFQEIGCHGIVADYPKFPDQTFPGFIKDARELIAKVRAKYPNSQIFLAGHSSGAHTALITAMRAKDQPVDGVIALAPPNWFSPRNWPRWEKIFDNDYESKKQETYSYVEACPRSTKFLLIHGSNDVTVSPKGTTRLHELLSTNNISSTYKSLPVVNHFLILGIFSPWFFASTKRSIKAFIGL